MKISDNFFYELFKFFFLPFGDKEVYEACEKYLEYHYLPKEPYKIIWKAVKTHVNLNNSFPTIGFISQQFNSREDVLNTLNEIKEVHYAPKKDILDKLEETLKGFYFAEKYEIQAKLYNDGKKDEAFKMAFDTGLYLANFSLQKETDKYVKIFGDFEERQKERYDNYEHASFIKRKCPFFIDELDNISHGGCDYGDTFLALSQSGVGKSKFLKHLGVNNARIGKRVLHIQAEGSKKECLDLYDATWTGQSLYNIESGNIIEEKIRIKLKKVINDILFNKGEVIVYSVEKFDSITMRQIREVVLEVEKIYGFVDMVLIDYLELIEPGNGKYYGVKNERERREQVSKEMKNLAVELNKVVGSCTQASDVPSEQLNNPLFVMTRHNVSEYKLIVKPFSYFFTFNQTNEEYENGIMRIYCDKIRKYKGKQTVTIAQCYQHERFYDRQRTMENYYKEVA